MEYTNGWLEYGRLIDKSELEIVLYCNSEDIILQHGIEELDKGMQGIYGVSPVIVQDEKRYDQGVTGIRLQLEETSTYEKEEYGIEIHRGKGTIEASTSVGILYGVFSLLRTLQTNQVLEFDQWSYSERTKPLNPLRMINHWDNMDGSIERGYAGNSFFFQDKEILINDRTRTYARLIASVGINGVVINNVNVKDSATELISHR